MAKRGRKRTHTHTEEFKEQPSSQHILLLFVIIHRLLLHTIYFMARVCVTLFPIAHIPPNRFHFQRQHLHGFHFFIEFCFDGITS